MKIINSFILLIIVAFTFSGCKKKDPVADQANVTFKFEHYVDQAKIDAPSTTPNYTNAAGNTYGVDLLKYYISNIVLEAADGSEVVLNNHDLIDAFGVKETDAFMIPNGDYVKMRFLFGVDADNNTSGDQSGDLDPSQGMFWSWATGYIFLKHEGKFLDNNNASMPLELHLGKQDMATQLEISLSDLNVEGVDKEVTVRFNLNNMYNDPLINFNTDNFRHSSSSETTWMANMKANLGDVFSYSGSNDL